MGPVTGRRTAVGAAGAVAGAAGADAGAKGGAEGGAIAGPTSGRTKGGGGVICKIGISHVIGGEGFLSAADSAELPLAAGAEG